MRAQRELDLFSYFIAFFAISCRKLIQSPAGFSKFLGWNTIKDLIQYPEPKCFIYYLVKYYPHVYSSPSGKLCQIMNSFFI